MKTFGVNPRPRALVTDVADGEFERIRGLFGTARRILDVKEVRQAEWDALITRADIEPYVDPNLYVLAVGSRLCGRSTATDWDRYVGSQVARIGTSLARELDLPYGLPPAVERAVRRDLLPKALARESHETVVLGTPNGIELNPTVPDLLPFLSAGDRAAIAGRFTRRGGAAESWTLPDYVDLGLWTEVAVDQWRQRNALRFPRQWFEEAEWLTLSEVSAVARIDEVRTAREQAEREMESNLQSAEQAAREASHRAESSERRLLMSQGDELVAAVSSALSSFGLSVRNMDAEFPPTDRREDLRLRTPDDSSWEAIVEVRGYGGGAQVGDLTRLDRFANRYERDEGRPPSSCWYVCNQLVGQHPSERPRMLASNPAEVAIFREERPLALIDSAQFFKLIKCVQSGALLATEARSRLVRLNDVLAPMC